MGSDMNDKHRDILKIIVIITATMTMMPGIMASATDWTGFHAGLYNIGVTPDKAPVDNTSLNVIDVATSSTGSTGIYTESLVVNDTVYSIAGEGIVYAVDINTGDVLWTSNTDKGINSFVLGAPGYGNGTLFIPTNNGQIFALDADTGTVLWSDDVESNNIYNYNQMNTPVTYEDGRIYFGEWLSYGGPSKYFCYDENGNEIWNRDSTSGAGYYRAACAIVDDVLIYPDDRAYLASVYKENGTLADEINISAEYGIKAISVKSAAVYDENSRRIYVSTTGGYCIAIGLNEDGTFNRSDKVISQKTEKKMTSTPAIYNGRLYLGTGSSLSDSVGAFYCFNSSTLELIWTYLPGNEEQGHCVQGSPIISTYYDDGDGEVYIYFTTNIRTGSLYCLKDWTGNTEIVSEQWCYTPEEDMTQFTLPGPVVSDGKIIFANDAGYLFIISEEETGDWNPWNDETSAEGVRLTTAELQEAINLWLIDDPIPQTGEFVTTQRLQELIDEWINT